MSLPKDMYRGFMLFSTPRHPERSEGSRSSNPPTVILSVAKDLVVVFLMQRIQRRDSSVVALPQNDIFLFVILSVAKDLLIEEVNRPSSRLHPKTLKTRFFLGKKAASSE